MRILKQNKQLVAFVILTIGIVLAMNAIITNTADKLYQSQIAACEQTQTVVKESNHRIPAGEATARVLRQFLVAARKARLSTYNSTHLLSDRTAAQEYTKLIEDLDLNVHFQRIPLLNCQKVVAKP